MRFYAVISPRGWDNEYSVWAFESRLARDEWVEDSRRRESISRSEARRLLAVNCLQNVSDGRIPGNVYLETGSNQDQDRRFACLDQLEMRPDLVPEGTCTDLVGV